jgi:hypothetical protein
MRLLLLLALLPLALAGCGKAPPPPAHDRHVARVQPAPPPPGPGDSGAAAAGAQAADFLRIYYRRIESGDYGAAWRMQGVGRVGEARFAANFRAYRDYHALVGLPSDPAAGGGWIYVEVPVMITGRFVAGKPFGSAGRVTLRRPDRAGAGWTIYTG